MRTLAWRDLKKNLENALSQENEGKPVDDEQENLIKLAELFESHRDNMMLAEYVGLKDEEQKNEKLYKFLKEKMDINKNAKIKEELEKSELYEILANFHFPVIYTTNYDQLLEKYFERMDFKSFMDVLLQADIMKYHILFWGYSLSDINIKLLLYLARKRWEGSESKKEAFIFTATPNKIQKAVFKKNGIVTFSGSDADKK